jgi:uncharacterized protein involved in exopolysaccharide biosynthesis
MAPPEQEEYEEDEIDLLTLGTTVFRGKREILRNSGIVAVGALILSLLVSNTYTAKTTILPPEQGGGGTAAAMLASLGPLAGGLAGGVKDKSEVFVAMLKSERVEDALIKRFGLAQVFDQKLPSKIRSALEKKTSIAADKKDGIITIEVTLKDPVLAAKLANAYVEELNGLTKTLAITEASQRRLFFENQLNLVKDKLGKSEFDLEQLQSKTGLIQVYPHEKEIAEANAKLRAEIAAREIQLSAMQVSVTERNPEYQRIQNELTSLKAQLRGANPGEAMNSDKPGKSLDYIMMFRDVKFDEAVMELLFKQYEAAKIDEAKDYPLIQVLDKAAVPDYKSGPKRALIVILSSIGAFFLSILWVFIRAGLENSKEDPERAERLVQFKNALRWRT